MNSLNYVIGFMTDAAQSVWNLMMTYWITSIPVAMFFIKKAVDLIKKVMLK